MLRHRVLLVVAAALAVTLFAPPARSQVTYVGPTDILLVKGDSVAMLRTTDWQSKYVRHQEKLLLVSLRMKFWRDHLPADMRAVFDALGYPTGRVLLTPVGHTEEWWYYGTLQPPLRFRDGELIDVDRFDSLRSR
ncbi:MAG TPA: hypothetical protein VF363_10690 [Candidatus Eisenbacteria bacterium]